MIVLDPGHRYQLAALDGTGVQTLHFVKRNSPPEKFPGNRDAHSGTTTQEVLRALIERMQYVNGQVPCDANLLVIDDLRSALRRLEVRAARMRGLAPGTVSDARAIETLPCCPKCGHTFCSNRKRDEESGRP